MHMPKKGLRALGIAESYSGRDRSTLAGRRHAQRPPNRWLRIRVRDGRRDGCYRYNPADSLRLNRRDINVILLSGCVIAFFNIIDPMQVHDRTGLRLSA